MLSHNMILDAVRVAYAGTMVVCSVRLSRCHRRPGTGLLHFVTFRVAATLSGRCMQTLSSKDILWLSSELFTLWKRSLALLLHPAD